MANGHVEIHDPFSDSGRPVSRSSNEATSEKSRMEDTMEFRVLMAYTQRRRPSNLNNNGSADCPSAHAGVLDSANQTVKPKKKKKKKKVLSKIFQCVKPPKEDPPEDGEVRPAGETNGDKPLSFRSAHSVGGLKGGSEEEDLEEVVSQLIKMADKIPFSPPEVEEDSPEEDASIGKLIGLLLRDQGDKLNESVELRKALQSAGAYMSYTFFEKLMQTLLRKMGLRSQDPDASQKTQIAVTCEVTSRLSAADTLPMNRLLGYGATYLKTHSSPWAQHHGGYEEALNSDDEDEVH
ncbi:apoptosis facilitator Bcl-2-like protein 14 isoform X2 [Synchiropus splendidus]|uniref:apoptosis facilitator Bcl-2-like protein 14 isoform X2 n=1 Tax=Synchiropus splendidus TaxID=270530 RepID=UPI00237ECCA3|nr:apoptosis facilitator Bcl-2-like protein 14 isoform X2 [Synchiropus splendidus]